MNAVPAPVDPSQISNHSKELLIELFTYDQLVHLAAIKRAREPYIRARRSLSAASIDELAEMLIRGDRPTVGWWRRHGEGAS
ncbi:MAG TPA: hypothetical protein VN886_02330 [Acidimicrobiales bacterium]|nr:hypothetical protein [Acidimicrobiales bacterium]